MKTFFRGVRRYLISACLIMVLIICSNIGIFLFIMHTVTRDNDTTDATLRQTLEMAGQEISDMPGGYRMSKKGRQMLKEYGFVWAMALNEDGTVVWEWKLPDDIPRQYTLFDVATFTRWYLKDYPVRVWKMKEIMLVCAYSPNDISIYNVPLSVQEMHRFPYYIKVFIVVNLLVIFLFILLFGWRFYASIKPISEGIERISRGETVHVKEKGTIRELAEKLNGTSLLLKEQEEKLSRRDQARADWIAGVSHDIRTPLTLIVGYAERLMESPSLDNREKTMAQIIQKQSGIIKQLIADLNLTSKLSYDAFPLHLVSCIPAQILRECVADTYNQGLQPQYSIAVVVTEAAEKVHLLADVLLLKRAIYNVLGNSIRHNPEGCQINIRLSSDGYCLHYLFVDSGPGIPDVVVSCLEAEKEDKKQMKKDGSRKEAAGQPHIMGMRLTKQIIELHGGTVCYYKRKNGNYDCGFIIPKDFVKK